MGAPAAKQNDRVNGVCQAHLMPGPTGQQPAGPQVFSAPVTYSVATSVEVEGEKAVKALASFGLNDQTHIGLTDPFGLPPTQRGIVTTGSSTVFVEGQPMASSSSRCVMCFGSPATLAATGASVLVG